MSEPRKPGTPEPSQTPEPPTKKKTEKKAADSPGRSSGVYELNFDLGPVEEKRLAPPPVEEVAPADVAPADVAPAPDSPPRGQRRTGPAAAIPEVARSAVDPFTLQQAQDAIDDLVAAANAEPTEGDPSYPEKRVRQALSRAKPVIEGLPQIDDPVLSPLREQLIKYHDLLERQNTLGEENTLKAEAKQARKIGSGLGAARSAAAPQKAAATPQAHRGLARKVLAVMLGAAVLGGGIRLVVLYTRGSEATRAEPEFVHEQKGGAVVVRMNTGGRLVKDLERGVPVIASLRLIPDKEGGLRAAAEVIDQDSANVPVTFTWYKDGQVIRSDERSTALTAKELVPPGRFKVEAVANDGTNRSAPLMTQELPL